MNRKVHHFNHRSKTRVIALKAGSLGNGLFLNLFGGVYSDGVPPDPFSNSEVKPVYGENSAGEALC